VISIDPNNMIPEIVLNNVLNLPMPGKMLGLITNTIPLRPLLQPIQPLLLYNFLQHLIIIHLFIQGLVGLRFVGLTHFLDEGGD
jgi:hypothetical protein